MKTLIKLKDATDAVKKLGTSMAISKRDLAKEIEKISAEGRSESWTKDAIEAARKLTLERSYPLLAQIQEANKSLLKYGKFWNDREAVLSRIPLTARGADGLTADNLFAEATMQGTVLDKAKLQSNERLKLSAEYALAEGNIAEAYLYSLEGNSRETSARIDMSSVVIPEQIRAQELLAEANKIAGAALLDFREIGGTKPGYLLVERLSAGHGTLV